MHIPNALSALIAGALLALCTALPARASAAPAPGGAAAPGAVQLSYLRLPHGAMVDGVRVAELSGLAWDADENLLYAVSDQGTLFHFRVRQESGTLANVEPVYATRLGRGTARHLLARGLDAEGLVLTGARNGIRGDTELLVAIEGPPPGILRFSSAGAFLGELEVPGPARDAANYRKRGQGLEAIALHPEHGIVTAPETPLAGAAPELHTLYAEKSHWSFPRLAPGSRLKAFDFTATGQALVLERSPGPVKKTLAASVRRVPLSDCGTGGGCQPEPLFTLPAGPDNFEGMAQLDPRRILLVSDNGGKAALETVFVLVTLGPPPQ